MEPRTHVFAHRNRPSPQPSPRKRGEGGFGRSALPQRDHVAIPLRAARAANWQDCADGTTYSRLRSSQPPLTPTLSPQAGRGRFRAQRAAAGRPRRAPSPRLRGAGGFGRSALPKRGNEGLPLPATRGEGWGEGRMRTVCRRSPLPLPAPRGEGRGEGQLHDFRIHAHANRASSFSWMPPKPPLLMTSTRSPGRASATIASISAVRSSRTVARSPSGASAAAASHPRLAA